MNVQDPSVLVDHRDGNGLNNRRENLFIVSKGMNNLNLTANSRNNKTGFPGVYATAGLRYYGSIRWKGKQYNAPVRSSPAEAYIDRLEMQERLLDGRHPKTGAHFLQELGL